MGRGISCDAQWSKDSPQHGVQLQSLSSCFLPGLQAACVHGCGQPGKKGQQSSALVLWQELGRWTPLSLSKSSLLGCRQEDTLLQGFASASISGGREEGEQRRGAGGGGGEGEGAGLHQVCT